MDLLVYIDLGALAKWAYKQRIKKFLVSTGTPIVTENH